MEIEIDVDGGRGQNRNREKGRGFRGKADNRDRYGGDDGEFESLNVVKEGNLKSIEGWIIFVTNIHEDAQEEDVHAQFSEYGLVQQIHLNLDRRTGFVKGYCLIEYKNYNEAKRAIQEMNGNQFLGKNLNVGWAFKEPPVGKTLPAAMRIKKRER